LRRGSRMVNLLQANKMRSRRKRRRRRRRRRLLKH
jgi:hypothetical protein